jgi:hypothetical protein
MDLGGEEIDLLHLIGCDDGLHVWMIRRGNWRVNRNDRRRVSGTRKSLFQIKKAARGRLRPTLPLR